MKITRLRIKNYRGIEALDQRIGPHGLMVKGPNGVGKTSVLTAIRAALVAHDIGPDAIRIGTERAEILVDLDMLAAERVITASGSRLKVTETGSDKPVRSPQGFLADMLGTAPLDPIDLLHAKDRKKKILAALPVRVTEAQVAVWLGYDLSKMTVAQAQQWVDICAGGIDYGLHGLEVVDQVRKHFYQLRTGANAAVKEFEKSIEAMIAGAPPVTTAGAPSVEEAERLVQARSAEASDLRGRAKRVEEAKTKTQGTQERIAKLTAERQALLSAAVAPDDMKRARATIAMDEALAKVAMVRAASEEFEREVIELRAKYAKELKAATDLQLQHTATIHECDVYIAAHAREQERAQALLEEARGLAAAIAATAETAPAVEEITKAEQAHADAQDTLEVSKAAARRAEHDAKIADAKVKVKALEARAAELDRLVQLFAKEVPNQLLKAANAIEGLALDGDDIFIDGVRLDALSGREQMLFAVEIARRMNVRSKILVVDGLERIDATELPIFISAATKDGYQLLATRVDAGDVVLEAIEPEDA